MYRVNIQGVCLLIKEYENNRIAKVSASSAEFYKNLQLIGIAICLIKRRLLIRQPFSFSSNVSLIIRTLTNSLARDCSEFQCGKFFRHRA